jgi:hypothetical protein
MSITKRYIHPLRDAIEKARVGKGAHTSAHTGQTPQAAA